MCKSKNMLLAVVIVVMKFQGLLGQGTLSITSKTTFESSSSVNLRYVPTGSSAIIEWRKAGSLIMSAGNPTVPGKYEQTIQTIGSTFVDLTINDINKNDLDSPYHCVYGPNKSNQVTLRSENYYSPPCIDCGWNFFGLACYGALIAFCGGLLLAKVLGKLKILWDILDGKTGVVAVAFGLLTVFSISFFIGMSTCVCEGSYLSLLSILIGLFTHPIVMLIAICYERKHDASTENSSPDTSTESRPLNKKNDEVKPQDDVDIQPFTPTGRVKDNAIKSDSMEMTSENGEEKKKKKKKKNKKNKKKDGQDIDGHDNQDS